MLVSRPIDADKQGVTADHRGQASTDGLKDWIAGVATFTVDFVVLGLTGVISHQRAALLLVGCALGWALWCALGPGGRQVFAGGSQLAPYLPPVPATLTPPAAAELEPDPDPATVTTGFRLEWAAYRWLMFIFLIPVLPFIFLRRWLDSIA